MATTTLSTLLATLVPTLSALIMTIPVEYCSNLGSPQKQNQHNTCVCVCVYTYKLRDPLEGASSYNGKGLTSLKSGGKTSRLEMQPEWMCSPGLKQALWSQGNGNSLQYSHWDNPMDRGAWQATVHGVIKSQTLLSDHTWRGD